MRAKDRTIAQGRHDHISRTRKVVDRNKAKQVIFDASLAQALECFANLEDRKDAIERFEKNFNGFFPPGFFTWLTASDRTLGPQESNERTPGSDLMPFWLVYKSLLRKAWRLGFPTKRTRELMEIETAEDNPESILWLLPSIPIDRKMEFLRLFDFRLAIASLAQAGWRAKACKKCHTPFVADEAGSQFCRMHRRTARLNSPLATHA